MSSHSLGLVFFPAFDWAISPTHPERQERLLYTRDQIMEEGLLDLPGIREYRPRVAQWKDIERVHFCVPDAAKLVSDAHLVSAGGAITAADAVMRREVQQSFALVRPPGHHAMRVVHGTRGFCLINIEAVMIEYLRKKYGIRKVAVVDTDVHHGDGTQDIFYHDPDTLFISFHQDGRTLYPGTGFIDEMGSPNALCTTVNLPLPPGTTDAGLHTVLDELILPVLDEFQPDITINSAGQDNHYSDPLAGMSITAQGYARLADKLKADIAVLEGGYSIEDALPYVNVGIILAMAGLPYDRVAEPDRDKVQLIQSRQTEEYIKRMTGEWRLRWQNRENLRRAALAQAGDYWRRNRGIYYDATGIQESQVETVRLCRNCQGYLTVASEAEGHEIGSQSAYCVSLPRDCCAACREAAKQTIFTEKKQGRYQHYYLQDKQQDYFEEC